MAKTIESAQLTLSLQVYGPGGWGDVRSVRDHYSQAQAMLEYIKEQRMRWEACQHFGDAPMRILWREPSGYEFTV